jgi:hypothetical protein
VPRIRVLILRDGALAFDGKPAELARRTHARRYIVYLNGDAPSALFVALAELGIGADRVKAAATPWEDIVMTPAEGEPR